LLICCAFGNIKTEPQYTFKQVFQPVLLSKGQIELLKFVKNRLNITSVGGLAFLAEPGACKPTIL
jgi:hypothetical protein